MGYMDKALTIVDVLRARDLLKQYLPATPLWSYPALDELAGARVHVKHENVQPVGAFKVRGGLTLLAGLSPAQRSRGVVTYSTGNHAQSIAYASRVFGNPCVVVMPEHANEVKVRATEGLGATVLLHGADLSGAAAYAASLARIDGMRLITASEEAALIAGVGTLYLETLEAAGDLDVILVPVGSGTGAAAACLVAAALAPNCQVIGVQSAASPAAHDSWRAGHCVERPNRTIAEGLATGRGCELPQRMLRAGLADFLLVSDEQIRAAQRVLASRAHTLAEGAGAASLAGLLAHPERFAGQRVAVICTGANAAQVEIAALAESTAPVLTRV